MRGFTKTLAKYGKPRRYVFAHKADGSCAATATWMLDSGIWHCDSASHHMRWMVGMTDGAKVVETLKMLGFVWEWRPGKAGVKPPFFP